MIGPLRLAAPTLIATALALAPSPAAAVSFNYCDFSSAQGLSVNYNASLQGDALSLTPNTLWQRGSAFTTVPFPFDATTSFHTFFRFRIGPNATGADGFAFVLQSGNATAIGNAGYGLGYEGIGSSFAVEFDTYDNGATDPDANHVAVLFDGNIAVHVAVATPAFALASDKDKYVWIDYDAPLQTLEVFLAEDPFKPTTPLISKSVDIDAHLGPNVRAGFVGATGGVSNIHAIVEWQMSTAGFPCCAAAPGGACGDALPACRADGLCVACLSNAQCKGNTPVCTANTCLPCSADADCAGNPAGPACSPEGACVRCTSDTTCAEPSPKCDTAMHTCVGCLSSADCAAPTPACDPATRTCVGCFEDGVCPPATPVCEVLAKQCVAGCHVVGGKDSCGPGTVCDKQDGTIGACQSGGTGGAGGTGSTSSSGTASSSSTSGSGGAAGSGGAGGSVTGSGGSATSHGGAGGSGGGGAGSGGAGAGGSSGGGGESCGCVIPGRANGTNGAPAIAAAALLVAWARRRRDGAHRG